jgi:hypothetical protein
MSFVARVSVETILQQASKKRLKLTFVLGTFTVLTFGNDC